MTGFVSAPPRSFPATTLPWIVAATALVVYAVTLNPWVSFTNVEQVARVSGWLWQPDLSHPLYFLVTLPIRLLPTAWVPAVLNLLNAICAAAVLGLLTRSVALLPHDRTHAQRIRLRGEGDILFLRFAWLPPVLAALVCGLQLTFWENATSGTREMLDLLVFAYVIHCLLVFRRNGRQMWLSQAAFLWGAGMSTNFAMVGFFPAFIVALVWIKQVQFFNTRFLIRMALWGLAGMSLYLLLPILQMQDSTLSVGFWQALKYNLATQKSVLFGFPKKTLLLLGLTSLLPLLLMSIRWHENFGDINPIGAKVAIWMFHSVHALFLVSCLWIALDPPVSPRNAGFGLPFLTFYYLAAIAIGYLAGYLLVVFGRQPLGGPYARKRSTGVIFFTRATIVVVTLAMAVGLLLRNLPQIRITNSTIVRDYTTLVADALPEGNTVVLSDDHLQLLFLRAFVEQRGNRRDVMLLDTQALKWPQYQQIMAKRHPERWPENVPTNRTSALPNLQMVQLLSYLSQSNHLCYAHPSFGYYFEFLQAHPDGILNDLHLYKAGELLPPPMSDEEIQRNEQFWQKAAHPLLVEMRHAIAINRTEATVTGNHGKLIDKLHLVREKNATATLIGRYLSRSLNALGVKLQRANHVQEAAEYFKIAEELNPENVVARVNLEFNADLQAGRPTSVDVSASLEDAFGKYRGWNQVVSANGQFDEPRFTQAFAEVFVRARLFRQALREFNRVRELVPNNLGAQLWYARLIATMGEPDKALQVVRNIRENPARFPSLETNTVQLLFVEASAYLARKDYDQVVQTVDHALKTNPSNTNLLRAALQLYMNAKMFTNCLGLINRELKTQPQSVDLLVNKGFTLIQLQRFEEAVGVLTKALELQEDNNAARFNRAIAYLRLGRLDDSQKDYETLLLRMPKAHPIFFGLGEIASRRHETNQAIYNYRLYLSNAPPRSRERQLVEKKLASLTGSDD